MASGDARHGQRARSLQFARSARCASLSRQQGIPLLQRLGVGQGAAGAPRQARLAQPLELLHAFPRSRGGNGCGARNSPAPPMSCGVSLAGAAFPRHATGARPQCLDALPSGRRGRRDPPGIPACRSGQAPGTNSRGRSELALRGRGGQRWGWSGERGWAAAGTRPRFGRRAGQPTAAHVDTAGANALHAPSSWPGAPPAIGPGHYEYLPFKVPFKMIMGTAPLEPTEWIQIDSFYADEMAVRKRILAQRRDQVLAWLPGERVEEAKRELLEMLLWHLPRRFPHIFQRDGPLMHNALTGESLDVEAAGVDPLELSARLVQEDLCLMLEDDPPPGAGDEHKPEYRFVAGAVLFPNGWDLREKLGMSTAAIHNPVPLYQEHVSRRVDAFMRLLSPEKPFWRANWSITADPTLFRPLTETEYASKMDWKDAREQGGTESTPIDLSNAGQRLFTRSERETFVRFPRTRAVLFTIRTFVKPLSVFQGRPDLAAECVGALDELPAEVVRYKMLGPIRSIAREFLVQCAEAGPAGSSPPKPGAL